MSVYSTDHSFKTKSIKQNNTKKTSRKARFQSSSLDSVIPQDFDEIRQQQCKRLPAIKIPEMKFW